MWRQFTSNINVDFGSANHHTHSVANFSWLTMMSFVLFFYMSKIHWTKCQFHLSHVYCQFVPCKTTNIQNTTSIFGTPCIFFFIWPLYVCYSNPFMLAQGCIPVLTRTVCKDFNQSWIFSQILFRFILAHSFFTC